MKRISICFILMSLTACNSYYHRPIQDQAVGGSSILDAITGRDRVGLIAKQAHYDSFISKPTPSKQWFSNIPILSIFSSPSGYEICRAPPADAMSSTAGSFAAAINIKNENNMSPDAVGALATSFANKITAFSIRTQGLQYIRDVRFDNCITWQNRGDLTPEAEQELRKTLNTSNQTAETLGSKLISEELKLRAITNNFGASSAEVSKEAFAKMAEQTEANTKKVESLLIQIKETPTTSTDAKQKPHG